jgi:hypothetical protein
MKCGFNGATRFLRLLSSENEEILWSDRVNNSVIFLDDDWLGIRLTIIDSCIGAIDGKQKNVISSLLFTSCSWIHNSQIHDFLLVPELFNSAAIVYV